jgi:hypothetical protein
MRDWAVSPDQGWLQGPLDLSFFRGQPLRVTLAAGQVALVERPGAAASLLAAGKHELAADDGQVVFLQLEQPVSWRFDDHAGLWVGRTTIPVIGGCSLTVADPLLFYDVFLRGLDATDESLLRGVFDALVRSRLEARLERTPAEPAAVQTALTHITHHDLTADLSAYGLACAHVAVYTRAAPVADPAGLFAHSRDNDR